MKTNVKETRQRMLKILADTRREMQRAFSNLDPERVVHGGESPWRVRGVIGHIGVWNGEAAQSLRAHAGGQAYRCISSGAEDDAYNAAAVAERRTWTVAQVWAEYQTSHDQLRSLVETLPDEAWQREMVYPWNEQGAPWILIEEMMKHEAEHRHSILAAK